TGALMGTPVYMSPEQCRGAGAVDHRADIYSIGCIIFEMLCGRPPFQKEGMGEFIGAHMFEQPPAPSSIEPGTPPALDALILRTLAKEPAHRPQSLGEVLADLSLRTTPAPIGPVAGATWAYPSIKSVPPGTAESQTTLRANAGE